MKRSTAWLFGAFQKVGVDFRGIPGCSLGAVVVKCFGFGSFWHGLCLGRVSLGASQLC